MATTLIKSGAVLQGVRDPEALVIDLYADSAKIDDMTEVTAVALQVVRGDGSIETWAATMGTATASKLTITHPWAAGENDTPNEVLDIFVRCTVPSGVIVMQRLIVSVTPLRRIP